MSKKNEKFPLDYEKLREQIIEFLESSNPHEAYSIIREILDYPGQIKTEAMFQDVMKLFEQISRNLAGDKLGDLVKEIITNPNDIRAIYDLAYELYEEKVYGIAATLLKRANELYPQNVKIITEFVSNLEALMLNNEARIILSNTKDLLKSNEFCRYLLAYNSLMTGNINEPLKILPTIQGSSDKNIQYMAKALEGMLDRFSALKNERILDNTDLRGWHMVLNGSILLHLSPYGLDVMNGRYAYISDSYSLCKHGIERIKEVLKVVKIDISRVISLPDRSSQILATATSKILEKPLELSNEVDIKSGLIVSYDLNLSYSNEMYEQLKNHKTGQILWAHASNWVDPFPFTPDITTFLYQSTASPWGSRMAYDQKIKKLTTTKPDDSDIEELSEKIINAKKDEDYLDD
ncbi:MAG: hypothetical protein ACFFCM_04275, partial [Promethearchaeota archaeon]